MKIGDVVLTPRDGRGRIVKGPAYHKPKARRGERWVFLFYPPMLTDRVQLFRESELRIVKG